VSRPENGTKRALGLLLLITLLKGVTWCAVIPVGQAPDEPSHLALAQFIGEFGRLPGPDDRFQSDEFAQVMNLTQLYLISFHPEAKQRFSTDQTGPRELDVLALDRTLSQSFELQSYSTAMHVPPLYHALGALGYRLVYSGSALARIYAVRLVSVVLTAILVVIAYFAVRDLFPEQQEMWVTVPLVVSFHPMVTFLGSVVNSDILVIVLFSLILWLSIRVVRYGLNWKYALLLGIAVGLGILTKPMVLASGLALAISLLVTLARHRDSWLHVVLLAALILVIAGSIGGWYLIRNYQIQGRFLYNDPIRNPGLASRADPKPDLTMGEYWTDTYRDSLRTFTQRSYWGLFGWVDTSMPRWIYEALRWLTWAAVIGVTIYLTGLFQRRPIAWLEAILVAQLVLVSVSLFPPVFLRGYSIARQTGFLEASTQGRYQLGAWLSQASLLVLGLTGLVKHEYRKLAHLTVRVAFVCLNVLAVTNAIIPRYYL
jgi:hypothetical protein